MIDVATVISYGLRYLKVKSMNDDIRIENPQEITHSLLHDLKNMVVDLQNIKTAGELLEDKCQLLLKQHYTLLDQNEHIRSMLDGIVDAQMEKIRIPHRCPVCNGSTFDDEGEFCPPCEGRGLVWG